MEATRNQIESEVVEEVGNIDAVAGTECDVLVAARVIVEQDGERQPREGCAVFDGVVRREGRRVARIAHGAHLEHTGRTVQMDAGHTLNHQGVQRNARVEHRGHRH